MTMKPKAEMVYFKRNGHTEAYLPVLAGTAKRQVESRIITRIVPLVEAGHPEQVLQTIKDLVCGDRIPRWSEPESINWVRAHIADLCDSVLNPKP
jgi:hypothetical protein